MVKTLGVVELQGVSPPPSSTAVVRSLEERRLGGRSLLDWVVRRVSEAHGLDQVIVVCPSDARGRPIAQFAPPNVPVFYGKQVDPLARFAAAVRTYAADSVVRISLGNPFVDPVLIDRLLTVAAATPGCDYVSYCSSDGRPAMQSHIGLVAEWCRAEAIFYAERDAATSSERQDVTSYIYSHPELFQLRLIPVPARLDRPDLRLAIQVEEDWDHAQAIYEALGPDSLDWQHIAGLLDHQPAMRQRMANLNRQASA